MSRVAPEDLAQLKLKAFVAGQVPNESNHQQLSRARLPGPKGASRSD
jgi:hypothetical protein